MLAALMPPLSRRRYQPFDRAPVPTTDTPTFTAWPVPTAIVTLLFSALAATTPVPCWPIDSALLYAEPPT